MQEIAFYNDQFVDMNEKVVPIQERGHQFGDGIYEVIRVYHGVPFYLDAHMQRLKKSAAAIELQLPFSVAEIKELCMEGLRRSDMEEAEIYMQITRGIHSRQHHYPDQANSVFSMTVRRAKIISSQVRTEGINVLTVEDDRWKKCYIKSLNLLPNVMAKQKAITNGCQEAVYHDNGIVKEGCSSNLFIVKNGVLATYPALDGILHGITRQIVMELAKERNIKVVEKTFTLDDLKQADEAFVTSTNMEIVPLKQVDEDILPTERPISNQLIKAYQRKVLEKVTS
ncbi:amino acid aminotransferase [Salipaludibacillus neizhouensis]|uniref:Amino acid aminotransferase n=1 Tax=Salipaludibacillus neizhouensis TaxID=885475 RepID=A0A3A9JZN5_9BACI|nr:aminotransferase class IV [Salipaludibacillus neizhouensis]RKL65937.1 amino acid aminotransferase [Salipaludibacillus neizhouensis]